MRAMHKETLQLRSRNRLPIAVNQAHHGASFAPPLAAQQLISIEVVCNRLEINRRTLYRWLQAYQDFPRPIRIGRLVRFRALEVMAWIDAREQQ